MKRTLDIVSLISDYLIDNPQIRFWQALVNMWILEYEHDLNGGIKDIYYTSDDEVVRRVRESLSE